MEDRYKAELRALIETSKHYPRRARRLGLQGRATVGLVMLRDGRIEKIRLIESTGYKDLDRAVIDTIKAVSGELPIPEEIGIRHWSFRVPLVFVLGVA